MSKREEHCRARKFFSTCPGQFFAPGMFWASPQACPGHDDPGASSPDQIGANVPGSLTPRACLGPMTPGHPRPGHAQGPELPRGNSAPGMSGANRPGSAGPGVGLGQMTQIHTPWVYPGSMTPGHPGPGHAQGPELPRGILAPGMFGAKRPGS